MKQTLRNLLRQFHLGVLKRPLPSRAAIYLHNVTAGQIPRLKDDLNYFVQQGYKFVGPGELCGQGSDKRILVSFDDNFRSWQNLLPALDQIGVTATFYINTLPIRDRAAPQEMASYRHRVDKPEEEPLSSGEIKEISACGHVIGCHSHSHLNKICRDLFATEIDNSKKVLEDLLGREVNDFALPYGKRRHFTPGLIDYCVGLGFKTIANAIPGRQHARQQSLWINRSPWHLDAPLDFNLENLQIDGRIFERLTGRRIGF